MVVLSRNVALVSLTLLASHCRGIAKGNTPESLYAVMSGTHFNGACCFDYGNSENTALQPVATGDCAPFMSSLHVLFSACPLHRSWCADACGAMEAIYLGNAHWQGNTGAGKTGPWVGADLEAGMYYVRDACVTIFVARVFALSIRPRLPCLRRAAASRPRSTRRTRRSRATSSRST